MQTRFLAPVLPEQHRIDFNFWRKQGWFVCAITDPGDVHWYSLVTGKKPPN